MALSYLKHGITDNIRNNRRKAKVVLTTWEDLPSYFKKKLDNQTAKLIRTTKGQLEHNPDYPMEARMMFGNACVPHGVHPTDMNLVKSIPCKDVAQGKKQLNQFIKALDDDFDTQCVVAQFLNGRKGFDATTIPSSLLENS